MRLSAASILCFPEDLCRYINELDSNNKSKKEYTATEAKRCNSKSIFIHLMKGAMWHLSRIRAGNKTLRGHSFSSSSVLDELIKQVVAKCDSDNLESYHIDLS